MTMQDRFKFRFWYFNDVEKKWKQEICVDLMSIDGNGLPFDNTEGGAYTEYDTEYITEQCTGLKDKNGKLIYEGDIVAKEFSDRPFSSKAKYKIKNCLVYWHKSGRFSIKYNTDEYRCYSAPYDSFIGNCEVVGNIHENPDLLENKDE